MSYKLKDPISLKDFVEMVVARIHGQGAVAKIDNNGIRFPDKVTSFKVGDKTHQQGKGYVSRAGKKITFAEDCERWDGAKNLIYEAFSENELRLYVRLIKGDLYPVDETDFQDGKARRAFESNNQEYSEHSEQIGQPVYLEQQTAMDWLEAQFPPEEPFSPKDKRGRPTTNDYDAFEKTLRSQTERLGGDEWIAQKTNAELAKRTRKWMGKDPNISNDGIPGQRAAADRIAKMRTRGKIPPKA